MKFSHNSLKSIIFILMALAALGGTRAAWAASQATETLSYSGPLPAGITALKVENLAGHVSVTQGTSFKVTATVVAGGKDQAAAQTLAQSVRLDTSQSGSGFTVHVNYPVNQYDTYWYPSQDSDSGNGDNFCVLGIFCVNGGGNNLTYQGTEVRVYRGGNRGTPLHVDIVIQVPTRTAFALINYVGRSEIQGLQNDIRIKSSSADAYAKDISGKLEADTGSGDVHVSNLTGDFTADTGSGDVFADHVTGNVHADTGSGDVHVSNSSGQNLYADTGSGDVSFNDVKGDMKLSTGSGDVNLHGANGSLHADTGSGDVMASDYVSGESVWADTGSGDVSLAGDLSTLRKLYIDTGSGDATLKATNGMSLHLEASSDSGDININMPDMRNVNTHRSSFTADIGKAEGTGTISTGSGDIMVSQQ